MWCCWICPGHDPTQPSSRRSGAPLRTPVSLYRLYERKRRSDAWGQLYPPFSKSGQHLAFGQSGQLCGGPRATDITTYRSTFSFRHERRSGPLGTPAGDHWFQGAVSARHKWRCMVVGVIAMRSSLFDHCDRGSGASRHEQLDPTVSLADGVLFGPAGSKAMRRWAASSKRCRERPKPRALGL